MPTLDASRLTRRRLLDGKIGNKIYLLRHEHGLRQIDLADAADMTDAQLSLIESGKRSLKFSEALAIAKRLGIPVAQLSP